jgi:mono/diheme cytochrome c family protein
MSSTLTAEDPISTLQREYLSQGAVLFSGEEGAALWIRIYPAAGESGGRSCASCHTSEPGAPGRHARTGKPIAAMSPSVNPERLTDSRKIEKWFKRNCKWTLGRECTPQERGDLLAYLKNDQPDKYNVRGKTG